MFFWCVLFERHRDRKGVNVCIFLYTIFQLLCLFLFKIDNIFSLCFACSEADEVKSKNLREQVIKNSPKENEDYFVVPKVIE